jgi:hypothetical protein
MREIIRGRGLRRYAVNDVKTFDVGLYATSEETPDIVYADPTDPHNLILGRIGCIVAYAHRYERFQFFFVNEHPAGELAKRLR